MQMPGPTPKREWVAVGETCLSPVGMRGEVLRITEHAGVPQVKVRWENGYTGTTIITNLRKAPTR